MDAPVTKAPVQSKTLWVNLLSILSLVLTSLLADENFRDLIGSYGMFWIIGSNVVNMILRGYTSKPLELKKPKQKLDPLEQALKDDDDEIHNL